MQKVWKQYSGVTSSVILVTSLVALTSMIWTVCTEPSLANVFWPGDIHQSVVQGLGGSVTAGVDRPIQSDVAWSSVFLRVSGSLLIMSLIGSTATHLRQRTSRVSRDISAYCPGLAILILRQMYSIAAPGLCCLLWLGVWLTVTAISNTAVLAFVVMTTPLFMAMILAGVLSRFLGFLARPAESIVSPLRMDTARTIWPELSVVILAILAWEATSFWMNERLYAGLLVPHGDSAMYEEHLWNVWHGKGFRSYLDQGLFLGEHIQVIHLLLLPLHVLFPSYLTMELFASFSLAVCAIPIFSIARRHSGSSHAAMWLALAWLMYFPMHYLDIAIDIKTLRPSCYGMPFLFWGIDFAERRKLWRGSLCFLVALSTQEDFSMVVGSIGLVLFLVTWKGSGESERRRMMGWSMGLLLFSIAYLLLAVLVVIPWFRGGDVVHYSRYFGDLGSSPGDLLRTALKEPGKVLATLLSFRTLTYLLVLTVPFGFLTWRRPIYLLAGVPTFLMLSLIQLGNDPGASTVSTDTQVVSQLPPVPYHHFHAPLLPVLVWAAAAGLKGAANRDGFARFAFCCALGTAVTGSMMPMGVNFWSEQSSYGWRRLYVPGLRAEEFEKVLALLPLNSRVASTDYVHTRLTHFERSYDYSDYLRAVNNYQPGMPADTDYIVIDTSHQYSRVRSLADVRELKVEPEKWEILPDITGGHFIVLKRRW